MTGFLRLVMKEVAPIGGVGLAAASAALFAMSKPLQGLLFQVEPGTRERWPLPLKCSSRFPWGRVHSAAAGAHGINSPIASRIDYPLRSACR